MSFDALELGLPNDPARPVLFAFSCAFLDNFNAFFATVTDTLALADRGPANVDECEIVQMVNSALRSLEKVKEITDWMVETREPLPFIEAFAKVQDLAKLGYDDSESIEVILSDLQKRPVGRPHRRQLFIKAFEFQLQSKQNTQGQATRKFCPCGNRHTAKCEQNLKAGMRSLKKVLRKYAPGLVSEYEVLHPDRAMKVNG